MSEHQSQTLTPRRIVDARFSDIDEFHRLVGDWSLDLCQLDPGASNGTFVQIMAEGIGMTRFEFSRAYAQSGETPKDMRTFGILDATSGGVQCCGAPMSDDAIFIFPRGEFEAISQPGFAAYSVSASEVLLDEVARLIGLPDVDDLFASGVHRFRGAALRRLRQELRSACREVGRDPRAPRTRERLGFEIPRLLVQALASTRDAEESTSGSHVRQAAVRRARELLEHPSDEPLTIREVCEAVGVSWRTLDYAFREHFGVSPKTYLKAIRLHRVRADLRNGTSSKTVAHTANKWGFWHMGQFAADYRRQFGELPSETLKSGRRKAGP
jgi:AraC family ethanolamine operon transcriptional activator